MRLSIRTKFLLLVSILLLLIFGFITLTLIRNSTANLREDLKEEAEAFASLSTQPIGNTFAIYKDSGTSRIDQQVRQFVELNESVTNITIVDINGAVVYKQNDAGVPQVTAEEASSFEPIFRDNDSGALAQIIQPYFEASGSHRYSIVYSVSDENIEKAVRSEAFSLLLFGVVSLAVTLILTYLLINRIIIEPIQQVSRQAGLISAGKLEQQIAIKGTDEISSLGSSVNRMADSLKADIAKLKEVDRVKSEFMMITSHNLRTPLTIINGYLENMGLMSSPDMLKKALSTIAVSAKRLDTFAEDILTISQFELGDTTMNSEDVPIAEFVTKLVNEFKPTADMKKLTFSAEVPQSDTLISMSRPHMRSALWNILDNAVKFTPEGGSVHLRLTITDHDVQIAISDTGIGISAVEMPKLFTKFHRGTSTMKYDFEGTGIGLYSSKMIVERLGGTIQATSQEGKGSTFIITLPITRDTTPRT